MNRDANSETRPEDDLRDALAGTGYRLDDMLSPRSVHERMRACYEVDGDMLGLTMVHFTQNGKFIPTKVVFHRMGGLVCRLPVELISADDDMWRLQFYFGSLGPHKGETRAETEDRMLQWSGKDYIGYRKLYHEPGRFTYAWSSNPDPRIDWTYTVLLFETLPEELKA